MSQFLNRQRQNRTYVSSGGDFALEGGKGCGHQRRGNNGRWGKGVSKGGLTEKESDRLSLKGMGPKVNLMCMTLFTPGIITPPSKKIIFDELLLLMSLRYIIIIKRKKKQYTLRGTLVDLRFFQILFVNPGIYVGAERPAKLFLAKPFSTNITKEKDVDQ